ncbi:AraC family transcriptional regulator [Paenibacillus marchantiophytorum]|uniref:AraC family transcriptional regulator n=1 Tax=Paenibacillus marchantiophytorum TaxID=1619310 RepID=A0ABQ1FEB0_9BACL|nr:AraC family transcriptional regulator [Paenibacillus marchantiophytorum]GGA08350.1 AraC family transcriptional regulator [Paenibacillus marchantiophytorum]
MEHDDFRDFYYQYLGMVDVLNVSDSSMDRIDMLDDYGAGTVIRTKLRPGIELIVADCRFYQSQTLRFQSDVPMIELSFWLNGASEINLSGHHLHIQNNQCQLAFIRNLEAEMCYDAKEPMLACEIRIAESVFRELVDAFGGDVNLDMNKLLGSQAVRIFQQAIPPAEEQLVRQMLTCPVAPPLRKMYLEGKALELLAIYMQRLLFDVDSSTPGRGRGLRRTDLDKIREAANILACRMEQPPSLLELSRLTGISDFKLKAGFKELFGTTVFGYLRNKRMERAVFLLETERTNVYEAAIAVGYSNPGHFAALFRETYGINPGQWPKKAGFPGNSLKLPLHEGGAESR